jgi:hypothetical protein
MLSSVLCQRILHFVAKDDQDQYAGDQRDPHTVKLLALAAKYLLA